MFLGTSEDWLSGRGGQELHSIIQLMSAGTQLGGAEAV